ncbi:MAG: four helix bundle protein, partial [Chthoniobacterales bacterium]
MKVWQRAKGLAVNVYAVVKKSPGLAKDFGLRDQMQRAAVSVCSNIAEGDERDTDKEAVRCFYIAKGSVAELITQLEIAKDARLIKAGPADQLIKEAEEIGAMLGALIKARA